LHGNAHNARTRRAANGENGMSEDALRSVVVARKAIEAHNMASFELIPTDGEELAPFSPGSHIDVTIPGGLVRQYSLVNPSTERHRYLIGIWRDANSPGARGAPAARRALAYGPALAVRAQEERAMATEADVWNAAWIIAEHYGAEGVTFAAQMAHSFQIGGKMEAYSVWVSVMEKGEELTALEKSTSTVTQ
jgi:hypothetical protein